MSSTSVRTAGTAVSMPIDRDEWRSDAADGHLVSLLDPTSIEADQYRTLRHVVERNHESKKVIAVTSAVAGDGKTTTVLNLAGALAHAPDARVLVLDIDLRTPSLGNRLGLVSQSPGLVDLVLDPGLTLDDVVRRHPRFNLSVVPAGRPLTVSYEMLQSSRLEELLHEARRRYDYILLDTPPLVPVPDSRLIQDRVDGFLLVVEAHRTPRKFLEDALNQMDPSKLMGIIFNGDDHPLSGYYGYYYGSYSFYHSVGRRKGHWGDRPVTSVLGRVWRALLG
jgi:capsular exopolysaccharide synthesis family protein